MVDHFALREPKMGILDRYNATHCHQRFTKKAGPVGPDTRVEQMLNMDRVMSQRGTPVRHACSHRQASTSCELDNLSSTESPSNESILQLSGLCDHGGTGRRNQSSLSRRGPRVPFKQGRGHREAS